MGGPIGGNSNYASKLLIYEAIYDPKILEVVGGKDLKLTCWDITFFEREADRLIHPEVDTLVVTLKVTNNTLCWILIDINSSTNILIYKAWKKIKLSHPLEQASTPLVEFSRLPLTPKGSATLPFLIRQGTNTRTIIGDFFVVDCLFFYNCILDRPLLWREKGSQRILSHKKSNVPELKKVLTPFNLFLLNVFSISNCNT